MTQASSAVDQVRQSERTIDNLKRLYAVLFSLSLGLAAASSLDKVKHWIEHPAQDVGVYIVNAELTLAFIITTGIFYFQGDRFLDTSFAVSPLPKTSPLRFGLAYLINVFTMAPFYLMAASLSQDVIDASGFLYFFLSFCVLILLGLILLTIQVFVNGFSQDHLETPHSALRSFWMIMNSLLLLAVLFLFLFAKRSAACPFLITSGRVHWFVFAFGLAIYIRDFLDYMHAWPYLYPVDPAEAKKWPIMKWIEAHCVLACCLGLGAFGVLVIVSYMTRSYDVGSLIDACSWGRSSGR